MGERALAVYLSSITGFIDALGFLYLGGFFLSFMSGNTTRMTAAAAEGAWPVAGKAAGVMALFLVGVMIGALISRLAHRHLPPLGMQAIEGTGDTPIAGLGHQSLEANQFIHDPLRLTRRACRCAASGSLPT